MVDNNYSLMELGIGPLEYSAIVSEVKGVAKLPKNEKKKILHTFERVFPRDEYSEGLYNNLIRVVDDLVSDGCSRYDCISIKAGLSKYLSEHKELILERYDSSPNRNN